MADRRRKSQAANVVVGRHPVRSVIARNPNWAKRLFLAKDARGVDEIASAAERAAIAIERVSRDKLDGRAPKGIQHQGVVLEVVPFPYAHLEDVLEAEPSLLMILDGVEDPRNLGAVARACLSFGADALVVPKDRAAQVTPAAHKAAAGALAALPVARVDNLARALDRIKEAGLWLSGADARAKTLAQEVDLSGRAALVIGGEDRGLRRLTEERCDHLVRLPMVDEEVMLNAADAATVLLYEAVRQRR